MSSAGVQLAAALGQALRQRHWRLAVAESCTGGGLAAALTAVAGSSDWFECGWVVYSNAAKQRLGVPEALLARHGAVSEAVVHSLAAAARATAGTAVAVAVSGIAGPQGGLPGKPVGTVCFAWDVAGLPPRCATQLFFGARPSVQAQASLYALQGLLHCMQLVAGPQSG